MIKGNPNCDHDFGKDGLNGLAQNREISCTRCGMLKHHAYHFGRVRHLKHAERMRQLHVEMEALKASSARRPS